ncbi:hypothetical protein NDU88_003126 [Pleurodeles waltl]|uniref:Uncharacterized protein n=1 Tax=Pleurodeles waltl TaxID=8319 RepID=A0AAV7WQN6_PLEWA|nr:hypothetical protein NDU88_003126 [Pleurodeles waltl]
MSPEGTVMDETAETLGEHRRGPAEAAPTLTDLMMVIQGSWDDQTTMIDSVAIEFILLRVNLQKVADRMTTAEENIGVLQ